MTIQKAKAAAAIIFDSNKSLIGRTRLQKLACLFELTGVGTGFQFSYHHYGPFSKDLSIAIDDADAINLVNETIEKTDWGKYSIYEFSGVEDLPNEHSQIRSQFSEIAKAAKNVEFELAVTAAFISSKGIDDPWEEVRKRKPLKAEHVAAAKKLYSKLQNVEAPIPLPAL